MAKVSGLKIALQGGSDSTLYASWTFNESTSTGGGTGGGSSVTPKVGDIVTIKKGSKWYNGASIPSWVMKLRWYVRQINGNRVVLDKSPDNSSYSIESPIHKNNITITKSTTTYTTKNTLDHYTVHWYYDAGNGVWFDGGSSDVTLKNATYNMPSNSVKVKVTVKPVSKTYKSNNKDVSYWTGTSVSATYLVSNSPPGDLSAPTVTLDKYTLKATIENIEDAKCEKVQFEVYKGNTKFNTGIQTVVTARATHTCSVTAGGNYRVRCRGINLVGSTKVYGKWSPYSSELQAVPSTPENVIAAIEADKSVRISWKGSEVAESYTVEYTTNKLYFDASSNVSSTQVTTEYAYITGLEEGQEWYFRVKATNNQGDSGWSEIVYKIIGSKPEAPTTWSLTTTAVVGEDIILYWVHNTEDGSKQVQANIELIVNGEADIITVDTPQDADPNAEEKVYSYTLDLSEYPEGAQVLWRVRTRGISFEFSDWSIQRTIDIYAPPTAQLALGDGTGILEAFPFNISVTAGPAAQTAITYHVSIIAEDTYFTTDNVGNEIVVNAGEEVYSKVFNEMSNRFSHDLMPEEITLENNQAYTVTVTVSMNSGLTADASDMFTVSWEDRNYDPDASITVDSDTLCAYIIPYCVDPDSVMVENIVLSVFRREYDGTFTEIASGLENDGVTTVTDPHPSLDFARYRIVARDANTSVCSYSDLPGIPVGEPSIVIQWDEKWTQFDYAGEDALEVPPWTGSMLRLKYNVDVSEDYDPDTSLVKYIGRKNPVSYYGTQKGITGSWSTEIPKSDKETVYALRRLAQYAGDCYVREPGGQGYWANVTVSMNTKHVDLTIPVTFAIERVESDEI